MADLGDMIYQLSNQPLNFISAFNEGMDRTRDEEDRQMKRRMLEQQIQGIMLENKGRGMDNTLKAEELSPDAVEARKTQRKADKNKAELSLKYDEKGIILEHDKARADIEQSKASATASRASAAYSAAAREGALIDNQLNALNLELARDPNNIEAKRAEALLNRRRNEVALQQLDLVSQLDVDAKTATINETRARTEKLKAETSSEPSFGGQSMPDWMKQALALQQAYPDLDNADALALATDQIVPHTDPTTGNVYLINRVTGQAMPPKTVDIATGNTPPQPIIKGGKSQIRLQEQVKDFSNDLSRTNLDKIWGQLDRIDSLINQSESKFSGDVAGYGQSNLVPLVALTEEGQEIRQSVQGLQNQLIYDRSGAAITSEELRRLATELGTSKTMSDARLKQGLMEYRSQLTDVARNILSGYPKSVLISYLARGGSDVVRGVANINSYDEWVIKARRANPSMQLDQIIEIGKKKGKLPNEYSIE